MEKEKVRISYSGSGVLTLNGFGTFFFIVAILSMIAVVISVMSIIGIGTAGVFITNTISALAAGAICKGLSTIAKTALYKRMLLEKQYNFVESEYTINELNEHIENVEKRKLEKINEKPFETTNEELFKYQDPDRIYISSFRAKKGVVEVHSIIEKVYSIGDLVFFNNENAPDGKYIKGGLSGDVIYVKDGRIDSFS